MQALPQKEASLFRQIIKNYEGKQYKKGLKAAEQILRKHPNHGDTQAMKALILNSIGQQEEAFDLAKVALKNAMKSHVCWHVYGLLYRSVKNYEEAIKAYKFALRLEPEQQNILRDLAILQIQMRDFEGYLDSRKKMMQLRSQLRQNWTAVAIAHHLAGNYQAAEHVLNTYENTLKTPPPRSDIEHSEAVLYKNTIIAESGDIDRALKHLDQVLNIALDRTAALELRAQYLVQLGRKEDAVKAYKTLLDRNNEYRAYYEGLEKALALDRSDEASHKELHELYQSYAAKSERTDAPRRIPLDFLNGDTFKAAADEYLRRMFNKGVPSTFANIKALYADSEKQAIIESLVLGYDSAANQNGSAEGETNGKPTERFQQSVTYFLANHYNYHLSRDLEKATSYIDKLLEQNPKSVDYNQAKARIWKHYGNTQKASEIINHARELDEKDRYINTKCAKYQLRNNENEAALKTMSKFTRNETVGGPLGDLHEMQCMWYLLEDGEAYLRQRDLGLALKRFTAIYDIFEIWHDDQFDFHSFSLRKGQIRAYIDMVRWEDHLRDHPFFTRAALQAVKVYLRLSDRPELSNPSNTLDLDSLDPIERKRAIKKRKEQERKEREKREKEEAERKAAAAAAAKKAAAKGDDDVKKEDADPKGIKLLETKEPLEVAVKFISPVLEFSPKNLQGQTLGFEVHLRRNKYLLALQCLNAAAALDAEHPKVHEQAIRFRQTLKKLEDMPEKVSSVLASSFTLVPESADLASLNDAFAKKHSQSAAHLQSAYAVRVFLDPSTKAQNESELTKLLDLEEINQEHAYAGLELLDEWKSEESVRAAYLEKAASKWPEATIFQKK